MPHGEETPGHTQVLFDGLHIPHNLGKLHDSPRDPRQVAENRKIDGWAYIHITQMSADTITQTHRLTQNKMSL